MKAPVGLLSSGAVLRSKMEGVAPTSSRLLPDGCVSKTLSKKTYHKSHNCKGAVRQKGHEHEVRCKSLPFQHGHRLRGAAVPDGRKISINCTGVEDALDVTMAQQTELDYLIYNDPLGYADLILNGDPEEYLKNASGSHGLEI